jgi:hypothetical protein
MNQCLIASNEPGFPALPVYFMKLVLPSGTDVSQVSVLGNPIELESMKTVIEQKPIFPYQSPVPLNQDPPDTLEYNDSIYSKDEPFPASPLAFYDVSYCRGYGIISLGINPMSYIPQTGIVSYYPEMTIEIETTPSSIHEYYRGSNQDAQWVTSLVDNPEILPTYQRGQLSSFDYPGGLCDPSDSYDYVIITRDILKDFQAPYNWTDFIVHNQQKGLTTTIITVEDIISTPQYYNNTPVFNDTTAKIREFCRDAYQDWGISYVLIAGDQDGVNTVPRRLMDSNAEDGVETDLYWSNLDGTFNDDADSRWGEEDDTGFDLYSELFIGSIPCDTGDDISNWMTKSFYYENNNERDYLENVAFYGGDLDTLWLWDCEGDDFMDFTLYGTSNWFGPDPNHDGPWPGFLGFMYGFDTWNTSYPNAAFNTSIRWTGEGDDSGDNGPNPGWQGGSESLSIAGLKNAINNDQVTILNGIAHSSRNQSIITRNHFLSMNTDVIVVIWMVLMMEFCIPCYSIMIRHLRLQ